MHYQCYSCFVSIQQPFQGAEFTGINVFFMVIRLIFYEGMNTFILRGHIKLIKSDSNEIYNVTKISISDKCTSFETAFHQSMLKYLLWFS